MNHESQAFITTNPLLPAGPAAQLFIAGVSVFEITVFLPPLQRVTILGINLPEPDTFGPFDSYVASLTIPDAPGPLAVFPLVPTEDNQNWAATTLLNFGGTLPNINVSVRPQGFERTGDVILQGPVFP
jgi:hypothetical protein